MKIFQLLEEAMPLRTTMLKLQQRIIDEVDEDATFKFHNYANLHSGGPATRMIVTLHKYAAGNPDGEYSPSKHPTVPLEVFQEWNPVRVEQAFTYFKMQVREANPQLKKNKADHLNRLMYAAFPTLVVGDKDSGTTQKPTGFWAYKTEADLKSQRGQDGSTRSKLAAHVDVHSEGKAHGYMLTYPDKATKRVTRPEQVIAELSAWCGKPHSDYESYLKPEQPSP